MSRRLAILALLLVALSGVVPTWACAAAQQHDCCPDRQPCDSGSELQLLPEQAACCSVSPVQSQPVVVASVQKDTPAHSPSVDDSPDVAPPPSMHRTRLSQGPPLTPLADPLVHGREQLLYLRTGRLRL